MQGPHLTTVPPVSTAVVRGAVAPEELATFFDGSFAALAAELRAQGVVPTGAAHALYRSVSGPRWEVEVGLPVDRSVQRAAGVGPGQLPGGRAATLVHEGAYDGLGSTWERLQGWVTRQGLTRGPVFWEVYLTEPSPDADPDDLRTALFQPVEG
nr:GyrI-like domain-containing protein [Kineococcus sp. TRM81007]